MENNISEKRKKLKLLKDNGLYILKQSDFDLLSRVNFKKYFNIYLYLQILLFINLLIKITSLNHFSEINLTIKGNGNQKILNNYSICYHGTFMSTKYSSVPNEIYVNNNLQNYTGYYVLCL